MLVTLGLGRLETEIAHKTVTSTDVDEFLEYAEAVDVHTLAREGMPEALDYLHRRQAQQLAQSPSPASHVGRHRAETIFARDFESAGTSKNLCVWRRHFLHYRHRRRSLRPPERVVLS